VGGTQVGTNALLDGLPAQHRPQVVDLAEVVGVVGEEGCDGIGFGAIVAQGRGDAGVGFGEAAAGVGPGGVGAVGDGGEVGAGEFIGRGLLAGGETAEPGTAPEDDVLDDLP